MSFSKQNKQERQERLAELPDKLENYQSPSQERSRRSKKTDNEKARQILVERLILEAIENGQFDDLPGKGKPLPLNKNPYLEPGQDLAFDLLKRNGFAPEWIERDKEIRRELERIRCNLERAWQQRKGNPANEPRWQAALARFEEALFKLNRKIDDLNLIVPGVSLQRARLQLNDEVQRLQKM